MLPAERGDMRQQIIRNGDALRPKLPYGAVDARSPKALSLAARLEPRWHGSTMSAHRLCHGLFPLTGPDWLILTTQSGDRIRPLGHSAFEAGAALPAPLRPLPSS